MRNLRQLLRRSGLLSNEKRPRRSDKSRRSDSTQRRLGSETLEKRQLLAGDVLASQHNYWNGYDVNDDGQITSRDALAVINQLGRQRGGEGELSASADGPKMFYDVNADHQVSAADALSVINALGRGEETGELVEIMLNARTTDDDLIPRDGNGEIDVEVGEVFDLEVSYDDLRLFGSRLGLFQLFTDIEAFDSQGNRVEGAISPVLNENQRIIIGEELTTGAVAASGVTFTIEAPAPGAPAGTPTTYVSSLNDFGNNSRGEVAEALRTFGYTDDQFSISPLSFDNDDLGFDIFFDDDAFGNVDLPNLSVDVNETVAGTEVPTSVTEFAPFLADGVTPNTDAVQFNIDARSRTFNNNEDYYSSLNRGEFDPSLGFSDIGGLASQVPIQGGGIPDVTDDGNFIEPFDAYSVRVFVNRPVQGLELRLSPGEDREATLLYGRDDFVPQDLVLVETVDSNNNGIARLVINAGDVVVAPGTLGISPATLTVNEGGGTATLTVSRTNGSDGAVSVDFTTVAGTAVAGEDFTTTAGTLNFAAGETTQSIVVPILNDTVSEQSEAFTVTLSNATGGASLGATTSTVTITDDDNVVVIPGSFAFANATISVQEAAGNAVFTVNRTGGTDGVVALTFITANGTASAGSDYTATSGTLTFEDGETSKTISVPITNDAADEGNETFTLSLSNPTGGGTLGGITTATATIIDDDNVVAMPGVLTISPAASNVNENAGTATFTITRSGGSDGAISVNVATANGTASAGSDYTAINQTVNFAEGETTQNVTVNITDDTADEANETFTVAISNPSGGATLGANTVATATIIDNDETVTPVPGVLSIDPASVTVSEAAGTATFTINRTGGDDGVVSVTVATANGTATAGNDYTAVNQTLSFADGQTSQVVTVTILDDTVDESSETFTVRISNPTGGATLGTVAVSTATITDNDDPTVTNNPPTSGPVTVAATEDVDAVYTAATILANASPGAGEESTQTLSITGVQGTTSQGGTASINASGGINYSPADDFFGNDSFTVTITDSGVPAASTTFTVTVNVASDNDAPIARPDTATAFTGSTTRIDVTANDSAGPANEDQALTVINASSPNGVVVINNDGTVSFTPNANFNGQTTINYTVRDSGNLTASSTVTVTVQDFAPTTLTGSVFIDNIENLDAIINQGAAPLRNGIHDSDEAGFAGITVRLLNAQQQTVASVITELDGGYEFVNVAPGSYTVVYDVPETILVIGGTSAVINIDPETGGGTVAGPSLATLGTQGSAIETMDIIASSYLQTNPGVSDFSDRGREGGLVSLGGNGDQEFLIVGEGFDGIDNAEFVLSDSGDTALLLILAEGSTTPMMAQLSSDHFVVSQDGRGAQFFGGMDDFDFVSTNGNGGTDFSEFQDAIDRFMATV